MLTTSGFSGLTTEIFLRSSTEKTLPLKFGHIRNSGLAYSLWGWGKYQDIHLCNPVCPFEIFLECLILQADYEEQLVVVFCQYQASFQLLAMTKTLNLFITYTLNYIPLHIDQKQN